MNVEIPGEEIDRVRKRLDREAEGFGYHLNPDPGFTRSLVKGLLVNEGRYGYMACPCRLASGRKDHDRDIICPCDYRDPDLSEYGSCYCALYVSKDIKDGRESAQPIPERRPPRGEDRLRQGFQGSGKSLSYPVWRCDVCGYLCARDGPPGECPICKAKKDRFSRFI
ncbi:MAG: ferredoxin-thioredoxin reductase catalytic domain-containing protein [Candidatus Altiarchaeota archaeon]